jgi:hypothetical protein
MTGPLSGCPGSPGVSPLRGGIFARALPGGSPTGAAAAADSSPAITHGTSPSATKVNVPPQVTNRTFGMPLSRAVSGSNAGAVRRWRIWTSAAKLSGMTSYENFWLATAAAAPVIALAAVVALPETSGLYRDDLQRIIDEWFGTPTKLRAAMQAAGATELVVEAMSDIDFPAMKGGVTKTVIPLRVVAAVTRWTAIGNVMLQAVLLAFSLAALAYNVDVMPRWLSIVLTVGGILLLAATVSLVSYYRKGMKELPEILEQQMIEMCKEILSAPSKTVEGPAEEQVSSSDDNA